MRARFRRQLITGHVAMLVITAITAIVAIVALEVTTTSAARVGRELADDLFLAQRVRLEAEQVVAVSRAYLLTGQDRYRGRLHELEQTLDGSLRELAVRARAHAIERLEDDARDYITAVHRAAAERRTATDATAIVELFEEELKPRRITFEGDLDALVATERRDYDQATTRSLRLAQHAQIVVVIASALAMSISVLLAVIVHRRLAKQFRAIEAVTKAADDAAAARKEILEVVSHDLRTPLNAIVLATSLLDERIGDAAARVDIVRIANAATRMERLIADLLDVTRLDAGRVDLHCERCDVCSLIGTCLDLFDAPAHQRAVTLAAESSGPLPIYADRERMIQVVSNLVGNAIKFTRPGGKVTVRAAQEGSAVRIAVTDSGPGIAPEQRERVFDRYWQGRTAQHGLGLGLYICKQLVEAHHGRIGVESELGAGSTFWFVIPNDHEQRPSARNTSTTSC